MILPFKKNIITALEIDGEFLRIVQAKPFAQERKITTLLAEKLPAEGEKVIKRLILLFDKLTLNPALFIVSIPHQLVTIRNLELPSINPLEIKDIVDLQVGKQTPYSKDEIIYDYQVISTNVDGYSKVMLAIVHRDVIERQLRLLEKAGLKTDNVSLSSEGLLKWANFTCKLKVGAKPYVVIDIGYDKSSFTVIEKGKLVFSRNISVGFLQSENSINDWQDKLVNEIINCLHAYPHEMIEQDIAKIIITGADSATEKLQETVLKEKIGLVVEIAPQFEKIPLPAESSGEYKICARNNSFACLLGFILSYPEQKFNLVPTQVRLEKEVRERGRDLYLFGIYLVFILALISSIFLGRMYSKECYLDQLKERNLKIKQQVDVLDRQVEEIEFIQRRMVRKDFALNFIYEIHKAITPDVYLTLISFDGKEQLTIRGTSNAMSEIFRFISTLEETKYFQSVKTKFATTRKTEGQDLTEFEIVCPLEPEFIQLLPEK